MNEEILIERISGLKQNLRLKQRLNNRKCCRRERIKRERIWEKTSILKNIFSCLMIQLSLVDGGATGGLGIVDGWGISGDGHVSWSRKEADEG